MSPTHAALVAASVLFGLLRILGYKDPIFQAFAHLYVGGLIGAYFVNKDRVLLWMVVALSVVEVICFILVRRGML